MLDPFKRAINYLRISVTDRCNLRCIYCMPAGGIDLKRHRDILSYEQIGQVVEEAVGLGIDKVRLTGGEPLVRKDTAFLIRQLKTITGLRELTLTTNGLLLKEMANELKESGLDRLNISLDTLDPGMYRRITRIGDICHVLNGIDAAREAGFQNTKINMVLLPGINDQQVESMKAFCAQKGLSLQRINAYSLDDLTSLDPHHQAERPLPCELCNRIRLTADGKLKPCLFSDLEIPIDFTNIRATLTSAIHHKPPKGTACHHRQNWQIGG